MKTLLIAAILLISSISYGYGKPINNSTRAYNWFTEIELACKIAGGAVDTDSLGRYHSGWENAVPKDIAVKINRCVDGLQNKYKLCIINYSSTSKAGANCVFNADKNN